MIRWREAWILPLHLPLRFRESMKINFEQKPGRNWAHEFCGFDSRKSDLAQAEGLADQFAGRIENRDCREYWVFGEVAVEIRKTLGHLPLRAKAARVGSQRVTAQLMRRKPKFILGFDHPTNLADSLYSRKP